MEGAAGAGAGGGAATAAEGGEGAAAASARAATAAAASPSPLPSVDADAVAISWVNKAMLLLYVPLPRREGRFVGGGGGFAAFGDRCSVVPPPPSVAGATGPAAFGCPHRIDRLIHLHPTQLQTRRAVRILRGAIAASARAGLAPANALRACAAPLFVLTRTRARSTRPRAHFLR